MPRKIVYCVQSKWSDRQIFGWYFENNLNPTHQKTNNAWLWCDNLWHCQICRWFYCLLRFKCARRHTEFSAKRLHNVSVCHIKWKLFDAWVDFVKYTVTASMALRPLQHTHTECCQVVEKLSVRTKAALIFFPKNKPCKLRKMVLTVIAAQNACV